MKKLLKQIRNYLSGFSLVKKPVEEKPAEEKTPFEERRELVDEQFKHLDKPYLYGQTNSDRKEEILEGITKGTFVLERILERERLSAEEEFKLRLFEDMRKFIDKYFEDETIELRKEIASLKDSLERKEREVERLKERELERFKRKETLVN